MTEINVQLLDHPVQPSRTMYQAMLQDHRSHAVSKTNTNEETAEARVVKHCLQVNKRHWGILEHPQLTFGIYNAPRFALMQLRTHRHTTWDIQSLRETGDFLAINGDHIKDNIEALTMWEHLKMTTNEDYYIKKVAEVAKGDVEEAFALEWISPDDPFVIYQLAVQLMCYAEANETKKERLRGIVGDSVRCHGTVSLSLRALLHLASVRLGGDTQDASRHIVTQMLDEARKLFPNIIQWFDEQEPKKLTLSP